MFSPWYRFVAVIARNWKFRSIIVVLASNETVCFSIWYLLLLNQHFERIKFKYTFKYFLCIRSNYLQQYQLDTRTFVLDKFILSDSKFGRKKNRKRRFRDPIIFNPSKYFWHLLRCYFIAFGQQKVLVNDNVLHRWIQVNVDDGVMQINDV